MTIDSKQIKKRRGVIYFNLLSTVFGCKKLHNFEKMSTEIIEELNLPSILLDPDISIENLTQRFPDLKSRFDGLVPYTMEESGKELSNGKEDELSRAIFFSKLMANIFSLDGNAVVSATQYASWCDDVAFLEKALGLEKGALKGKGNTNGFDDLSSDIREMEADMIKRMRLREVLKDNQLVKKMRPNISLVEQLLRDKSNLSGVALKNARLLIHLYIEEVSKILKTKVEKASAGRIDYSVSPKRKYANLDLKKTLWKNLIHWNPKEKRLYVDQIFYKRTSRKSLPAYLIVVVDQSGSMVDAMVNCTILASIFAGLPRVNTRLIAYDTNALDLSSYINDPFEVLLRTQLGGGTDGTVAMEMAKEMITEPLNTVVVWISDFYEWKENALFQSFQALKSSGARFIPVGSVGSTGYQSVNPWFKKRFKDMGTPIISGNIEKLIVELKHFLS